MEYFCILNIPKRPKFAIITPSNRSLRKDTIKAARKPLHTSFPQITHHPTKKLTEVLICPSNRLHPITEKYHQESSQYTIKNRPNILLWIPLHLTMNLPYISSSIEYHFTMKH